MQSSPASHQFLSTLFLNNLLNRINSINIHFILSSTLRSPKQSLLFRYSNKIFCLFSFTCPVYLVILDLMNLIIIIRRSTKIMKFIIMQFLHNIFVNWNRLKVSVSAEIYHGYWTLCVGPKLCNRSMRINSFVEMGFEAY